MLGTFQLNHCNDATGKKRSVEEDGYWAKARRIGREVYQSQVGVDVDEQAGPAYFAGWALSRHVFWKRLKTAVAAIPAGLSGTAVDFGCGFGLSLPLLRTQFQRAVGVDLMPRLSKEFLNRWDAETGGSPANQVEIVSQLDHAQLQPGTVDLVLALDVFEHIQPLCPLLDQLSALLSPTGVVVVSGPTESALYRLGRRLVGFSGDYHVSDIYQVERDLQTRFSVEQVGRIPRCPALFEILLARSA